MGNLAGSNWSTLTVHRECSSWFPSTSKTWKRLHWQIHPMHSCGTSWPNMLLWILETSISFSSRCLETSQYGNPNKNDRLRSQRWKLWMNNHGIDARSPRTLLLEHGSETIRDYLFIGTIPHQSPTLQHTYGALSALCRLDVNGHMTIHLNEFTVVHLYLSKSLNNIAGSLCGDCSTAAYLCRAFEGSENVYEGATLHWGFVESTLCLRRFWAYELIFRGRGGLNTHSIIDFAWVQANESWDTVANIASVLPVQEYMAFPSVDGIASTVKAWCTTF